MQDYDYVNKHNDNLLNQDLIRLFNTDNQYNEWSQALQKIEKICDQNLKDSWYYGFSKKFLEKGRITKKVDNWKQASNILTNKLLQSTDKKVISKSQKLLITLTECCHQHLCKEKGWRSISGAWKKVLEIRDINTQKIYNKHIVQAYYKLGKVRDRQINWMNAYQINHNLTDQEQPDSLYYEKNLFNAFLTMWKHSKCKEDLKCATEIAQSFKDFDTQNDFYITLAENYIEEGLRCNNRKDLTDADHLISISRLYEKKGYPTFLRLLQAYFDLNLKTDFMKALKVLVGVRLEQNYRYFNWQVTTEGFCEHWNKTWKVLFQKCETEYFYALTNFKDKKTEEAFEQITGKLLNSIEWISFKEKWRADGIRKAWNKTQGSSLLDLRTEIDYLALVSSKKDCLERMINLCDKEEIEKAINIAHTYTSTLEIQTLLFEKLIVNYEKQPYKQLRIFAKLAVFDCNFKTLTACSVKMFYNLVKGNVQEISIAREIILRGYWLDQKVKEPMARCLAIIYANRGDVDKAYEISKKVQNLSAKTDLWDKIFSRGLKKNTPEKMLNWLQKPSIQENSSLYDKLLISLFEHQWTNRKNEDFELVFLDLLKIINCSIEKENKISMLNKLHQLCLEKDAKNKASDILNRIKKLSGGKVGHIFFLTEEK